MLKAFLLMSLALTMNAQASCIGEAQIRGTVSSVEVGIASCRAFLSSSTKIDLSAVCPLDEIKLANQGIEIGTSNGHNCTMKAGDFISGILVDNGYYIYLE
jgi:hypothetical protein